MIQIIALIGGVAALLVALAQINEYFQKSQNTANLITGALSLVVVGFAAQLLYFGPKSAGDAWTNALRNVDGRALRAATCDDGPLARGTSGINATALELLGGLTGTAVTIADQAFIPITNQYEFTEREDSLFTGQGQPIRLKLEIWQRGITEFCVGTILEVNGQKLTQQ